MFVGVLSYSLYLYHQPVLVFYRFYFGEIGIKKLFLLVPLMLILAYASYRFFENPLRRSQRKAKYLFMALLVVLVFSYANGAMNTGGYPKRQPEHVKKALVHFVGPEWMRLRGVTSGQHINGETISSCAKRTAETACRFGGYNLDLVIVGDSYAGVFTYSALHEKNFDFLALHHGQCPLLTDPIWFGTDPYCWEVNKKRWKVISGLEPTLMLIGTNYHQFRAAKKSVDNFLKNTANLNTPVSKADAYASFRRSIERLLAMGHKPIVLLQPPKPNMDVKQEMQRKVQSGVLRFDDVWSGTSTLETDKEVFEALKGIDSVVYVYLNDSMCRGDGKCLTFNEQGGLYNNMEHLSYFGTLLFLDEIEEIVSRGR